MTHYVLELHSQDVHCHGHWVFLHSALLLDKYRRVIRRYKEKSRHIIVPGILPRIHAYAGFRRKAISINAQLRRLSSAEGVSYISAWEHFNKRPDLFRDGGLHLNEVGSARLGRLLNEEVVHYSKNGERWRGTDTP